MRYSIPVLLSSITVSLAANIPYNSSPSSLLAGRDTDSGFHVVEGSEARCADPAWSLFLGKGGKH